MLLHRNAHGAEQAPLDGLIRTPYPLEVCVVCGHERVHGERHRATCPTCGATLNGFPLYRDLHAGR